MGAAAFVEIEAVAVSVGELRVHLAQEAEKRASGLKELESRLESNQRLTAQLVPQVEGFMIRLDVLHEELACKHRELLQSQDIAMANLFGRWEQHAEARRRSLERQSVVLSAAFLCDSPSKTREPQAVPGAMWPTAHSSAESQHNSNTLNSMAVSALSNSCLAVRDSPCFA